MVYGILKLLNFAHGEVFMIGSYIGYFVLTAFGGAASPDIPVALLIALMFAAAMLGSGVPRRRDRALRLPAAPGEAGAADRSADQRARRLVLPAADRRHLLRRDAEAVQHLQPRRRQVLHEHHHRTVRDPVHAALRDRRLGSPHGAADAVRRAHPGRPRDARDLVRPGGGVDDGHRRRPRHRGHVPHRLRARRCGGRHERADLPERRPVRRVPGRLDRVHGRRRRRDRQLAGRDARRARDRGRPRVLDRLRLLRVPGRDRLRRS